MYSSVIDTIFPPIFWFAAQYFW